VLQALQVLVAPEAEAPEAAARDQRSLLPSLKLKVLLLDMVLEVYDCVRALVQHLMSDI
jgi:hypothetical protein